jgi:Flp pilus assembly protein TadB
MPIGVAVVLCLVDVVLALLSAAAFCAACVGLQTAQLQRQLQLAESELSRLAESQAAASQRIAALQEELAHARNQADAAQAALEAAARDASQVSGVVLMCVVWGQVISQAFCRFAPAGTDCFGSDAA